MVKEAFVRCIVDFFPMKSSKDLERQLKFLKEAEKIFGESFLCADENTWILEAFIGDYEENQASDFEDLVLHYYRSIVESACYSVYYLEEPQEDFAWQNDD